jgi:hypothetical protein
VEEDEVILTTAGNPRYYVIAPIEGLHLDFDYRMYSAEVYGCPPDYKPNPQGCSEFRHPYEIFSRINLGQYNQLAEICDIDPETIENLSFLPNRKLSDFTCLAFSIDLDDAIKKPHDNSDQSTFNYIIDKGERLLDAWRLCIFKPGEDASIGKFGAIGNGVQCFWIGEDNTGKPRFIARKTSRFALTQKPFDVLLSEFGPIYNDHTFRGLCVAAYYYPSNEDEIKNILYEGMRAFRESRELPYVEARFRQLATIAETLAKKYPNERIDGKELRERIAKISTAGWDLYKNYNTSRMTTHLSPDQYKLIWQRYDEVGWSEIEEALRIITDLWSNVRNPLSHNVSQFSTLNRDAVKDLRNMERVIITMINGLYAAWEVQEFYEKPIYEILLDEKHNNE